MKQQTLALSLALVLGSATFGTALAQEQGIRPVPEDLATQPVDERTEDTMPYPESSLQAAQQATDESVQDAGDETVPMTDESDAETASTDVSPADEAAAADSMADTSELPADSTGYAPDAPTAETAAPAATATAASDTRDIQAGSMSSPASLEQALATRFQSGDENGDGLLSEAEVTALDDDDLQFATIDADGDGSVTAQEWSAQLQSQVASADNDAE